MILQAQALWQSVHRVAPGLLVTSLVAMAAAFLGSHYKGSLFLLALLLGMALRFLYEDTRCKAGIEFASTTVLRIGVALLGLRLTLENVFALGWHTVLALAAGVVATMACAVLLARILRIHSSLGLLVGGATAICGASAALAIASVLPRREGLDRDTTLTVIGVTTLSTLAMVLYPVLSAWLGFDAATAGRFIGATVHDVAQVVGAGYAISSVAGDVATTIKLIRVAMLMPTLLLVALLMRSGETDLARRAALLPWFVVAFGVLVLVNSSDLVPSNLQALAGSVSQASLVVAISGVGLKTPLRAVTILGWRPLLLLVFPTTWLAALAAIYLRCGF